MMEIKAERVILRKGIVNNYRPGRYERFSMFIGILEQILHH